MQTLARYPWHLMALGACLALLLGCAAKGPHPSPEPAALPAADPPAPPDVRTEAVTGGPAMLAVAHPVAARIGRNVLAKGGHAVDAAVAVQAVLTLVEPQSSGIGGGAFMLHYDADKGEVTAYDGRETAPAAATPRLFLDDSGAPLDFWDAVIGGRAVGVPGVLRMLDMAHGEHGAKSWQELFQPAIQRAERGFTVTPRLHKLIKRDDSLRADPAARDYFFTEGGKPLSAGHRLRNPALAETLRRIAEGGADAFYQGPIARDLAAKVRNHPDNPGKLTRADLAAYSAKRRAPLCRPYRDHRVCGMPPPTSGGATVAQILGILSHFEMGQYPPMASEAVHLLAEASRLAFADRNRFLADSDFVDVPLQRLLAPRYLAERAGRIRLDRSLGKAEPGLTSEMAAMPDQDGGRSTTHFSIVDAEGNVVSMTSSVEQAFGSHLMVRGFMLNNQLTDFAFQPHVDGRPVANRVQPGKRPRSSMSPTIVLDRDGEPRIAIGSPGGSRIIGHVVERLVALIDWDMTVQQAVNLPNVTNRNGPTTLEKPWRTPYNRAILKKGPTRAALAGALRERGHAVETGRMTSGLHAIVRQPDGSLAGAADPRREGMVLVP